MISRRHALKSSIALLSLCYMPMVDIFAHDKSKRIKIGACDWSIGQDSNIEALHIAKEIGLDGVQLSLGNLKNNMHLRQSSVQNLYREAAQESNVAVGGIAIGALNGIPYKSDPRGEQWVSDSIDVAKSMGCKVVLLAFFGKGDLKGDIAGTKAVIEKLRKVAPKAEKNNIVLGIESWLSAAEHMEIIDAVGSPNVKVYYDVANSQKMGYDIYDEIRWLGKKNICEFHAKENGYLLGQGKIDFVEFRKSLDDIDYEGWIMIESAVPKNADMLESYIHNNNYLRSILKV
jgi:L-ribulose-5-phosphate 3-epimerase